MVSLRKLLESKQLDCKDTFQSAPKRSQVHNVKSTESVCILTSLTVSGASALIPFLLLPESEGRITPSSKSPFHLYPITLSSGGGVAVQADRTGFLYIHFTSCSSLPSHLPFCCIFLGHCCSHLTLRNVLCLRFLCLVLILFYLCLFFFSAAFILFFLHLYCISSFVIITGTPKLTSALRSIKKSKNA